MKVILSRKGFDSSNGNQANPILPDGTMLSLPIPAKDHQIKFTDLEHDGKTYFELIKELKPKSKIKEKFTCHLDPDLRQETIKRKPGWKGLFGQHKAALSHLLNQGLKEDDLFLFFGWFKHTFNDKSQLKYKKGSKDMHAIYGYLQVGKIHHPIDNRIPEYVADHPHAAHRDRFAKNNTIIEARESLSWDDDQPGFGVFNFDDDLVLTKKGKSRSQWDLPDIFKSVNISYHSSDSFKQDYFQAAHKGQEFVVEESEKVAEWAKGLIERHTH